MCTGEKIRTDRNFGRLKRLNEYLSTTTVINGVYLLTVADLEEGQGAAAPWLGKWPKVGPFGPFRVSNSDGML